MVQIVRFDQAQTAGNAFGQGVGQVLGQTVNATLNQRIQDQQEEKKAKILSDLQTKYNKKLFPGKDYGDAPPELVAAIEKLRAENAPIRLPPREPIRPGSKENTNPISEPNKIEETEDDNLSPAAKEAKKRIDAFNRSQDELSFERETAINSAGSRKEQEAIEKYYDRIAKDQATKFDKNMSVLAPALKGEESQKTHKINKKYDEDSKRDAQLNDLAESASALENLLKEAEAIVETSPNLVGPAPGMNRVPGRVGGLVGYFGNKVAGWTDQTTLTDDEINARQTINSVGNRMMETYRKSELGGAIRNEYEFKNIEKNVIKDTDTPQSIKTKLRITKLITDDIKARKQIYDSMKLPDGSLPKNAHEIVHNAMEPRTKKTWEISEQLRKNEGKNNESGSAMDEVLMIDPKTGKTGKVYRKDIDTLVKQGYRVK